MRRILPAAAVILFCLGLPGPAHAETMVAPLLEWLADHCVDSGVYRVTSIEKTEFQAVQLSLTLVRSLRGSPAKEARDIYSLDQATSSAKRACVEKGDEFLVCFQHYREGEKRIVHLVNLDNPKVRGYNVIAVSSELKVLTNRKDILGVFEGRLKSHPQGDPVVISDYAKDNRVELLSGPLFHAIWAGSSCFIRVPRDLVAQVKERTTQQEAEEAQKVRQPAAKKVP